MIKRLHSFILFFCTFLALSNIAFGQIPTVIEPLPPVYVECEEDIPMSPEVSVDPNCDITQLINMMCLNTGYPTSLCDADSAPDEDGTNTWSMWLPQLSDAGYVPSEYWVFDAAGSSLEFYDGGFAHLTGTIENVDDPSYGFILDMWFKDGRNWTDWSANGGGFNDQLGVASANGWFQDWDYYILMEVVSQLRGINALAGNNLLLSHKPGDFSLGFQSGLGANNKNLGEGFGGWFNFAGHIDGQFINGNGDLATNTSCTPGPEEECPNCTDITCFWEFVDECGNYGCVTQVVVVQDETAPTFDNCPANETVDCDEMSTSVPDVTATDNCDMGSVTVEYLGEILVSDMNCAKVYEREWKATDCKGHMTSCVQTISTQDTNGPSFTNVPEDVTIECDESLPTDLAEGEDGCTDVTASYDDVTTPGNCPHEYVITRTHTLEDECGNEISDVQIITVQDSEGPVFDAYDPEITFNCNDIGTLTDLTATDNCGTVTIVCTTDEVSGGCAGSYLRECVAVDECGNETTATQVVNIVDDEPPVTNNPDDFTIECDDDVPTAPDVTATDNCDDDVTPTLVVDTEVVDDCTTIITWTWTAIDHCDNESTETTTVTITDTTPPVWGPYDPVINVSCDDNVDDCDGNHPDVTDNCDDNVEIFCSTEVVSGGCIDNLIRKYWAVDDCGNYSDTIEVIINVMDDEAPSFTNFPDDMNIECDQTAPTTQEIEDMITYTDNCTTVTLVFEGETTTPGTCENSYTVERCWSLIDACGNESEIMCHYVNVGDNTDPVINGVGPDGTYACGENPVFSEPSADDNCNLVSFDFVETVTGTNCAGDVITRTWTATDACGNTATASQTMSATDDVDPTITGVGPDGTYTCGGTPVFSEPTADDNCNLVSFENSDVVTDTNCAGDVITRTWTATDNCGNTTTVSQTMTPTDDIDPTIIGVGSDGTYECGSDPVFSEPIAGDNCNLVSFENSDVVTDTNCAGDVITRTWTATDNCGNTTTVSQTMTPVDDVDPSITGVGQDGTYNCGDNPVFSTPDASDNCNLVSFENSDVVTDTNCAGDVITRTWTATDNCGNTTTVSQTMTPVDNVDPTITGVGPDGTFECGDNPMFSEPEGSDDCNLVSFDSSSIVSGSNCAGEIITRTWTATDNCGNTTTASQTMTPVDNTDPTITGVGQDGTYECGDDPVFSTPDASDNCNLVSFDSQDVVTDTNCAGDIITRTWTATDNCGNTTTASQTMTPVDNVDPSITGVGADGTYECGDDPVFSTPDASDNCNLVSFDSQDVVTDTNCAGDVITRTWTATDNCGNTTTASQTMTPVDDVDPSITGVGQDGTYDCGDTPEFSTPDASDNCNLVSFDSQDVVTDTNCAGDVITRTWTATDNCGNTTTASQTMTPVDDVDPTITGVGQDGTYDCGDNPVFSEPSADDNCNLVSFDSQDVVTDTNCAGDVITRTWTATDNCGNTTTASQTMTPVDDVNPIITGVGPDGTYECGANAVFSEPDASDNCNLVSFDFDDEVVGSNCAGDIITRTWTATDNCGNTTTASQTMTPNDDTDPTITGVGADGTYECGDDPVFSTPDANDNCNLVSFDFVEEVTGSNCAGDIITRTWTAIDNCQNTTTASQTMTPVDDVDPSITGVGADGTYECGDDPVFSTPDASDNCNLVSFDSQDVVTDTNCAGDVITRTWTATDNCGNTTTASQTMTPVDDVDPSITGVGQDGTYDCGDDPVFSAPDASDNCNLVSFDSQDVVTDTNCAGDVITRTWTATDNCGNTTTASQTMTPVDDVDPTITGVGQDGTYDCGDNPVFSEPSADDNCNLVSFDSQDVVTDTNCAGDVITRTWTATDNCGNTTTASQTMTPVDDVNPVITGVGPDGTYECGANAVFSEPDASDNCNLVSFDFDDEVVGSNCAGDIITRTWTATDNCGNTTTASQTMTPNDDTDPTITGVGADGTYECGDDPVFSTPDANDNCNLVSFDFVEEVTGSNCAGDIITRTWTAIDNCQNTTTASQTMTPVDDVDPSITGVGADSTYECGDDPVFSSPDASDNCNLVSFDSQDVVTDTNCAGDVITRTWTATDNCGNTTTASQTMTPVDDVDPSITGVGQDGTYDCGDDPVFSAPDASDNCNLVSFDSQDVVTDTNCAGDVITRTWTATDNCGNTTTASQTMTPVDDVDPTITGVGQDGTYDCGDNPVFSEPSADDNCNLVSFDSQDVVTDTNCAGDVITRTWTATDNCGNTTTASQTMTPVDDVNPVITGVGPDGTYECGANAVFSEPDASDNCNLVSFDFDDEVVGSNCAGDIITRTWTATDNCGNTTTASQTMTPNDDTDPTITGVGADGTYECGDDPVFSTPDANDNCNLVSFDFVEEVTGSNCAGDIITRTWTAIDNCQNTTTASQTMTPVDDVDPSITGVGADSTYECGDDPVFSSPDASDNCNLVSFDSQDVVTDTNCAGDVITRTWTATDNCGNTTTASQTMTPVDDVDPSITGVGQDGTYDCGDDPVFSAPDASDNCNLVSFDSQDVVTDTNCAGDVITRTWTATDNCGNTTTASQTMTPVDDVDPTITGVGQDGTYDCGDNPVFSEPSADDNCNLVSFDSQDVVTDTNCAGDVITRTWTATDNCGNTTTASQTMTPVDDVNPVITGVGPDGTYECGANAVFSEPDASDNCNLVSFDFDDEVVGSNCAGDIITRTWTATDNCGNTTTASQTMTPNDDTDPTITGVGADGTYECGDDPVFSTPDANDNCNLVSFDFVEEVTGSNCAGDIITRTWTAIDNCQNTTTASQTMTPVDDVDPSITGVGADGTYECGDDPVFSIPDASDNCNLVSFDVNDEVTGTTCAGDVITRTWTATDNCGNTTTASQTMEATDSIDPVISDVGPDGTYQCGDTPSFSDPTASDNCNLISFSSTDLVTGTNCAGDIITRSWTAVDACGNSVSAIQTMTPVDEIDPVITGTTQDGTYQCGETAVFDDPSASDNCNLVSFEFEDTVSGTSCAGDIITRTWTATDGCGNTAIYSQTMTPVDEENPTITGVGPDGNYECGDSPMFSNPAADDDCNLVLFDSNDVVTGTNCAGDIITRTWTATDGCGNTTTASQTMTPQDNIDPVFDCVASGTCPEDETLACNATPEDVSLTASDNCSDAPVTVVENITTEGCTQTITRTYTATDACGNTASISYTITVKNDNIAPVWETSIDPVIYIDCNDGGIPTCEETTPDYFDNCEECPVEVFCMDESVSGGCIDDIIRKYWLEDACGNVSDTIEQIIKIVDEDAPFFTDFPSGGMYECSDNTSIPSVEDMESMITYDDNCSTVTLVYEGETVEPGQCEDAEIITRCWSLIDACGNESDEMCVVITTEDTTDPIFDCVANGNCPDDLTIDCADDVPGPMDLTATDNCDNDVMVTLETNESSTDCPKTITYTYTATDNCGNVSTYQYAINVNDNIAPVITLTGMAEMTIECDDTVPAEGATVTDNCDTDVMIDVMEVTNYPDQNCLSCYTITRTYTAVDECGNAATPVVQTITVDDNTAPVFVGPLPENMVLSCDESLPEVPDVEATDNCDDNVTVSYTEETVGDDIPDGAVEFCSLEQPDNAAETVCYGDGAPAWSMYLPSFVYGGYNYYTLVDGSYTVFADGTSQITATLQSVDNPAGEWLLELDLSVGYNWTDWSALGGSYKDDCGVVNSSNNYNEDWIYYAIENTSTLTGLGDFAGSLLSITHAPASYYYGYQVGIGANNVNSNFGSGGWFFYEGSFVENSTNTDIEVESDLGDFAFEHDCCPNYKVVRTWCATDCKGNEVCHEQCIEYEGFEDPTGESKPDNTGNSIYTGPTVIDYKLFPNPSNGIVNLEISTSIDPTITVEVFDVTGGSVYRKTINREQMDVILPIDLQTFKSGIYYVRLKSASSNVQMEQIMIAK